LARILKRSLILTPGYPEKIQVANIPYDRSKPTKSLKGPAWD